MVSEPSSIHLSSRESMADPASPPSPGWDWEAMTEEEKARIEQKMDKLMEMMRNRCESFSTACTALTAAASSMCHRDDTAIAPAPALGVPIPGPDSSATASSPTGCPSTSLVVATGLAPPTPTRCSPEGPSRDTTESTHVFIPAAAPKSSTAMAEVIPVLAATTALLDHVILTEVIPYNRHAVRSLSGLSNIGHLSGLQLKPPWPSWIGSGEHLQLPLVTEEVTAVGCLPQEDFPGDGVDMHQLAKFLFKQNYIGEQTKLQDILVQVSITNLAMQLINYHADHDAQIGMETSSVSRELYVINLDDIASFAVQMSSSDVDKLKCLSRDFQYLLRFNIDAHLSLFPWNPGGCLSGYSSRGLNFPCSYNVEKSSHGILGIVQIQGMLMSMGMKLTVLYHLAQLLMSWFLGVLIERSTMGLQFSVCIDIWVSSPLDPGQAADDHEYIVEPYFTKITYSQAIADVCRKQKTLQSLQVKCSSCPRFLQFEKMHDVMGALLESNSWPYWQSYSLDPIMRAPPGMHELEPNSCDFWVDILLPLLLVLAPDGINYFQGIFDYSHNKWLFDRKSYIFGWLQLVTKALSYGTSKNNRAYYAAPLTCSLGISCLGIGGCVDLLFTCTAAVYSEYGNRFRQAFSVDILPGQYHWQIAWPSQFLELYPAAVLTLGAVACYLHKRRLVTAQRKIVCPLYQFSSANGCEPKEFDITLPELVTLLTADWDVAHFVDPQVNSFLSSSAPSFLVKIYPAHGQILRKVEFEGSKIYASDDNLTREVITWSLTSLYGFNRTAVQSSNGTKASELMSYNQGWGEFSQANQQKSLWDASGCMLAWYSNEKWGTTSEHIPLHCFDQVWWCLSSLLAFASRIWLVAWAGYDLELSSGCGQALSQEGRNVLNQAVISNSVHVSHHYYIAFANKIVIDYNRCSNQVYSIDTEVHAPWDPGKSEDLCHGSSRSMFDTEALCHHPKTSAWGQAEIQEGRNVMALTYVAQLGLPPWVIYDGLSPDYPPEVSTSTYTYQETTTSLSSWDHEN